MRSQPITCAGGKGVACYVLVEASEYKHIEHLNMNRARKAAARHNRHRK